MNPSPLVRAAVLVLGVAVLAGCTSSPPSPQPPRPTYPPFDGPVPDFSGPWSKEFTQAFEAALTDTQRDVVADEIVTAAEYAQLRSALAACMAEFGAVVTFDSDGGMAVDPGSSTPSDIVIGSGLPTCESTTTGYAVTLYEQVKRNPDHLDEPTIVAACLHEAGIVDDDYTADDYLDDLDSTSSIDWSHPAVEECTSDPLGLAAPPSGF